MTKPFSIIPATFTAFHADGAVDLDRIPVQLSALLRDGADGAFVCGTTGEGAALTSMERMRVAEKWVEHAAEGFQVIVHVGHASAHEARTLAEHAARIGAHAIAAVAPYFLKPRNAKEVVDAIALIAAGAPKLPFYYYHVPAVTGIAVPAAQVVREARARIPNFRGIKFTDGDLNDFGQAIDACGDALDVFYGRDDFLLPALSLGVRKAVGMTYNFTTPLVRRLVDAFDASDLATARAAQAPIRTLIAASLPYGIVNALKAASAAVGVDCGAVRAPLTSLSADEAREFLARTGIVDALAAVQPMRKAA